MKVLVVGETGYIGKSLKALLAFRGHEVVGTSSNIEAVNPLDVTDFSMCQEIMRSSDFDAVINLAGKGATPGTATQSELLAVNLNGAVNLARAVSGNGKVAPFFVHVASSTEPRSGLEAESEYSRSKAMGTLAVREILDSAGGVPYAIARVHNTYGSQQPKERYVASIISHLRSSTPFEIGYPDRIRDFCYVDDVVENLARLVEIQDTGIDFEIGTGSGVSLLDVANMVCEAAGASRSLIRVRTPSPEDAHPREFANPESSSFLQCATPFEDGIQLTVRGIV